MVRFGEDNRYLELARSNSGPTTLTVKNKLILVTVRLNRELLEEIAESLRLYVEDSDNLLDSVTADIYLDHQDFPDQENSVIALTPVPALPNGYQLDVKVWADEENGATTCLSIREMRDLMGEIDKLLSRHDLHGGS